MRSETLELKTPWRSAVGPAALSIAFLAAAPPPPLFPQTFSRPSWAIQGFAAWREPSSSVLFGGIGFTKYWGVMGLRLGGALHLVPSNDASMPIQCDRFRCWHVDNGQNPFNVDVGAWMADAEVVFEPLLALPTCRGLPRHAVPAGRGEPVRWLRRRGVRAVCVRKGAARVSQGRSAVPAYRTRARRNRRRRAAANGLDPAGRSPVLRQRRLAHRSCGDLRRA